MKAIRITIDMVYQVPDEWAEEIREFDLGFFEKIEEEFHSWGDTNGERRTPVKFDLACHMGEVKNEQDDQKNDPLDGSEAA